MSASYGASTFFPIAALIVLKHHKLTLLFRTENGATQGGENTVGKNYKFNVDPTDDYNNY